MRVERSGTGSRSFLGLHGWASDGRVFAPLTPHIPSDVSFYSADLPGCGRSARPSTWSVADITAEIVSTVHEHGMKEVTIVGHCAGGIFGLFAARTAPAAIDRIVAIDPFAYLPGYFRLFLGDGFGRRAYQATFANPVGRWLTNKTLNAGLQNQTDMTASFGEVDHEVARRYLELFAAMGGLEQFSSVTTTVDLVYGEHTFNAVKKSVVLFQNAIPHARAIPLEGARHMPITEATVPLSRIIFGEYERGKGKRA